jgi:antitoxin component of MazEF toxin-antitoxin module
MLSDNNGQRRWFNQDILLPRGCSKLLNPFYFYVITSLYGVLTNLAVYVNEEDETMAALVRKLSQIGNSKGLILPQTVLEMLSWDAEAEVELKIEGKRLIVSPAGRRYATQAEARTVADKVFTKHRKLMEKLSK